MGTYRLILALAVVVAHASPLPGIQTLQAQLAVKTFFMISGFYMAMILTEKYPPTREGRTLFYTNRLLRIYPMYLVTLVFSVLFYIAASVRLGHPADRLHLWAQAWGQGSQGILALIGLSQITVVGLDVTPLFGFSPTAGFHPLSSSAPPDSTLAWRFNFLPHCWSIGAEVMFYALAPWLVVRQPIVLVLLAAAGFGALFGLESVPGEVVPAALYHLGILQVPYFLMGILSYSALRRWPAFRPSRARAVAPLLVMVVLTFSGWPHIGRASGWAYLGCAWMAIPVLFHVAKSSSWDRWIGELSYPIYLLHVPVKWVLLALRGVETKDAVEVPGWALVLATLAAALVMVLVVDRPLERFRRERFERRLAPDAARAGR